VLTETHNKFQISFFLNFYGFFFTNNFVLTESNVNKAKKTHSDWLKIRIAFLKRILEFVDGSSEQLNHP